MTNEIQYDVLSADYGTGTYSRHVHVARSIIIINRLMLQQLADNSAHATAALTLSQCARRNTVTVYLSSVRVLFTLSKTTSCKPLCMITLLSSLPRYSRQVSMDLECRHIAVNDVGGWRAHRLAAACKHLQRDQRCAERTLLFPTSPPLPFL